MSGVTPQSTTAGLAASVPKEPQREVATSGKTASSEVPGTFPETPYHDASEFVGKDDPSLAKNAKDSQQTFGVAPIPATSGIGNPVSLQPGEKVPAPSTFTKNTINSTVTTDKESYENSKGAPQLPNVVTPDKDREANGGMFNLPGITKNMIPESSLPMGGAATSEPDPGFTIQSAGPNSTTAALAGQVPLEPRGVPEVVTESQHKAGFGPEASGNPEAVQEKSAVEHELENKVPEEPATSEGSGGKIAGMAVGGAAIGGVAGAAVSHGLPASVQRSIDDMNKGSAIAPTVPDVVQESITESHQSPEAAADKTMVQEKSEVEEQLLKKVRREDDVGAPAPSSSAALAETVPSSTGTKNVPPATDGSAPMTTAAAPAQTPAAGSAMKQAVQSHPDSRDISPMSKPATSAQTQPTVTTGVGASSAPAASGPTPQTPDKAPATAKPSPTSISSASASTDKKSKRSSGFFGKLKAKFSDKDKK